jgi:hypothetical protein
MNERNETNTAHRAGPAAVINVGFLANAVLTTDDALT